MWPQWYELYHAVLSDVPLESPDLPLLELRLQLARRWEDRKSMSAQQAEDLVAALLREHHGGDVLRVGANAMAADGGIDLFVVSSNGIVKRAVQVKRRQRLDVEPVQEVRNFVGAMLLAGATDGIFVTTASRFTAPASQMPENTFLAQHKLSVSLMDGEQLLDLLEHTNKSLHVALPPFVDGHAEWLDDAGGRYTTTELLFGDLGRLRLLPRK
jgi:restriction endonuclease Mrr